jgi:hypothetical protein
MDISCPSCRHEQPFTVWNSIDAALDPELKDRLLSGDLTAFRCEKCGRRTSVDHVLLYHDADKRLMIWFIPGGEPLDEEDAGVDGLPPPDAAGAYQFRLVRSHNELKEKIYIADAGLDDRVVVLFKLLLVTRVLKDARRTEILFVECGGKGDEKEMVFASLHEKRHDLFSVPFDVFRTFADQFGPGDLDVFAAHGRWLFVHEAFFSDTSESN